jgi:hypothetical protein
MKAGVVPSCSVVIVEAAGSRHDQVAGLAALAGVEMLEKTAAFGPKDSARLPSSQRLDVSSQYEFRLARVKTSLGATVFTRSTPSCGSAFELIGLNR